MKNQHKEQAFMLSLAVLMTISAVCMVFFDVAGICGKIDFLQDSSRIFAAFGVSSALPRWFLFGWLSGTLLVLCGYGIYRLKTQQKRKRMLVLGLFLAFWLNALCYSESAFFLYMTLVVVGLFAMANIPPAVGSAITKGLVTQDSTSDDAAFFSRRQLCRMEWVCLFPLKRFLAGCMWIFCPAFAIMGMIASYRKPDADSLAVILLLLAVPALTASKVWQYVTTPCHCVPVLNKLFSRQEIEQLLMGENFTEFPLEDASLKKHMPVLVSDHWMFVEGMLVSRQLLLGGTVLRDAVTVGGINRRSSRLVLFYLDGSKIRTHKTGLYLTGEKSEEIKKALDQIARISIPSSCSQSSIAEKYHTILPEMQDPKEKLRYLLTHDISDIRQEYKTVFVPNREPHKKKRSQKSAERKG